MGDAFTPITTNYGLLSTRAEGSTNHSPSYQIAIQTFTENNAAEASAHSSTTYPQYFGGSIVQQKILNELAISLGTEFGAVHSDLAAAATSTASAIAAVTSSNSSALTTAKADILGQLNTKLGISDYNAAASKLKDFVDLVFASQDFYKKESATAQPVQLGRTDYEPAVGLGNYTLSSIPSF